MKRLLLIFGLSITAIAATYAYFSDTETSQNNIFATGSIDLKIDNTSYYNGKISQETTWALADLDDQLFFDFHDLKPGDWGEDTISLHVDTNESWACVDLSVTQSDDNTCNEPELVDDPTCVEDNQDLFDGELANLVNFVFWVDDGDNVLETTESANHIIKQGTAAEVLNSSWALADASQNIMGGSVGQGLDPNQTYYIGKEWCFGELQLDPVPDGEGQNPTVDPGITCDGSTLDNAAQTDDLLADFVFRAVQHRNNPDFTCNDQQQCRLLDAPASTVLAWSQGLRNDGATVDADRSIPANAADGAQGIVSPPDWFSLGFDGTITLEFDTVAGNGPGADIIVYEITNSRDTYPAELAKVEISQDNVTYHEIGTASSQFINGELEVDIAGAPITTFKYIRLTDVTLPGIHNEEADGFDVDFVKARYGDCVSPN